MVEPPLAVIKRAMINYWDEIFTLMICNFLWFFAQLLIITGPPATAALFFITNRSANGRSIRLADFWYGFKTYFGEGWKWGALNIAVILVLAYAAFFYWQSGFPQPFGFYLAAINVLLLAEWLYLQLTAFPFWLEQEDKRMRTAIKNAVLTQAKNIRLTIFVVFLSVVIMALSYFFPVLVGLVTVAFLANLGNAIVVAQVAEIKQEK